MTDETTARSVPTLDEMRNTLAKFDAAVDAQDVMAASVWAAVLTGNVQVIVDAISSGAYALVSREDREKALNLMYVAGMEKCRGDSGHYQRADEADEYRASLAKAKQARSLLHLDAPKET